MRNDEGKVCTIIDAYIEGCEPKISNLIQSSLKLLGAIAIGIAVVEVN